MVQKPIDWARQYAATMDDATSLRRMHQFACENLARDSALRQQVVDDHDEQTAVKEWDSVFAGDKADNEEACRLIEARLTELGLGIKRGRI